MPIRDLQTRADARIIPNGAGDVPAERAIERLPRLKILSRHDDFGRAERMNSTPVWSTVPTDRTTPWSWRNENLYEPSAGSSPLRPRDRPIKLTSDARYLRRRRNFTVIGAAPAPSSSEFATGLHHRAASPGKFLPTGIALRVLSSAVKPASATKSMASPAGSQRIAALHRPIMSFNAFRIVGKSESLFGKSSC